jgi:hypothetical protein
MVRVDEHPASAIARIAATANTLDLIVTMGLLRPIESGFSPNAWGIDVIQSQKPPTS